MSKVRVPTLQHMARNWRSDPIRIAKDLVHLADNPPTFNYNILYSLLTDGLRLGVSYETLENAIHTRVKRDRVRQLYLEILPLIWAHFLERQPEYIIDVPKRYYPVGRNLMIPFQAPFIYKCGPTLTMPWFSFWKRDPLREVRLSLFISILHEILQEDPDMELAKFEILDCSAPRKHDTRTLDVIRGSDVELLSEARKEQMLEVFSEGYRLANEQLSKRSSEERAQPGAGSTDPNQGSLF